MKDERQLKQALDDVYNACLGYAAQEYARGVKSVTNCTGCKHLFSKSYCSDCSRRHEDLYEV